MKHLAEMSLLIAEDDPHAQKQLKELLSDYFREIFQAYDGEEALSMYQTRKPDIILVDITMPKMDGLALAQKIKRIDAHQPIVFLSGHSDPETLLHSANIPVDGYVLKPMTDLKNLFESLIRAAEKVQTAREKMQKQLEKIQESYREKMRTLYYRSHYDHLTRMPNRFLFIERLTEALESARQAHSTVALFYIDLDHLKQINDLFGHQAGDHAIRTTVDRIRNVLDPRDIFARVGGDEFALIVESMDDINLLRNLAERIRKAASEPVYHHGKSLHLSCSIGISIFPQDTRQMRELIDRADQAMYRAKSAGKNGYCFWGN